MAGRLGDHPLEGARALLPLQRGDIGGEGLGGAHQGGVHLHVELHAVGAWPEAKGLHGAGVGARQQDGAPGQRSDRVEVPLHGERLAPRARPARRRQAGEEGVGAALGRERNIEDADLGLRERRHAAAVGVGEQLAAEADAEQRQRSRHRVPQQRLLGPEPGVQALLVRLLRAAHGEHRVVSVQRRQRLAPPGIAGPPGDPRLVHHRAEDTRNVDLRMPDDEDPARRAGRGHPLPEPVGGQRRAVG